VDPSDTKNWRPALDSLIDGWIAAERPFSSGEISAALRTHAPFLVFSALTVGEHLRDRFYGDTMPCYPSTGLPPVQVSRMTDGLFPDRTAADVEVFVYAPDNDTGTDHEFEVFIPQPWRGETMDDAPTPQPAKQRPATGNGSVVSILGAKVAVQDIRANVRPDGRIEIPRPAFELAVHLGGEPIRGGDSVYATLDGTKVCVALADPGNAREYKLSASAGRVIISPTALGASPATSGKKYSVEVGPGTLELDLDCPAN
jgi:hypothetical protein